MTLLLAPAQYRIAELRLCIKSPTDEVRRGLNRKAPHAAPIREMWAGQILWAGLSRADMSALAAFFERLDGRVTPFGVQLKAGFTSRYVAGNAAATGTLTAQGLGYNVIRVSVSGNPRIAVGTLMTLGVDTTDAYQMVECVQEAVADGSADIYIAPRLRWSMASSAVTLGTVTGKFSLAGDSLDALQFSPAYGTLSVDVVEALQA